WAPGRTSSPSPDSTRTSTDPRSGAEDRATGCGTRHSSGKAGGQAIEFHGQFNGWASAAHPPPTRTRGTRVGSAIKKRRKRMSKKKHRKQLRKTRHQRRNK